MYNTLLRMAEIFVELAMTTELDYCCTNYSLPFSKIHYLQTPLGEIANTATCCLVFSRQCTCTSVVK